MAGDTRELGTPGPGFGYFSSWLVLGGGRGSPAEPATFGSPVKLDNKPGLLASRLLLVEQTGR